MSLFKTILILLGTISLFLGVAGIFIPGLPTTPFILLTAGLYLRGSDRLYKKLVSNRHLGSYIIAYHSNRGMSARIKLFSIGLMWIMIALSTHLFIDQLSIKLIVTGCGIAGTVVMGFIVPTTGSKNNNQK